MDLKKSARTAKILSIMQLLIMGGVVAIPALVYAIKAENYAYDGEVDLAKNRLDTAHVWQWIALVAGLLFWAIVLL
ncbi:MAG TPA: CD225/dispanin family protein [Streptosporangiaceae bacterium]|nr:CD225/dispanin family protein [Streptosporangiaceae bacterium]